MAIYKNREVSVVSSNPQHIRTPDLLTISYKDGTNENVPYNQIQFTKEEKDALVKAYPSRYDSVNVISDEDLKAVRLGATPPSDPSFRDQAESQARTQRLQEENAKNMEKARKEVDKRIQDEVNAPVRSANVTPVSGDSSNADLQRQGIAKNTADTQAKFNKSKH